MKAQAEKGGDRGWGRFFQAVQIPTEAAALLRDWNRQGALVFVARKGSVLSFLYLRWLCGRLKLPRLTAAPGVGGLVGWLVGARHHFVAVEEAATQGRLSLVFLESNAGDAFPQLLALQRGLDRPILLVPALLVWSRRAQKLKPSFWDVLFGQPEAPSRLATAIAFLRHYRRALLRLGNPIDLSAFLEERFEEGIPDLARKVRGSLHQHLARQFRAVVGPPLKKPRRMRDAVMRDRSLRTTLERISADTSRPFNAVWRQAGTNLREIASLYSPTMIEAFRYALGWLFTRIYDGIEIDAVGLERLKQEATRAPLVLCPSHKSHIDYLVLSYVFYENGLVVPHVAAGINLAFWPFGGILRRGGAFFIRRSIRGDRIYTAVLRAYVKRLLRDRFPQEFFVEGGRSRTGKLLRPKTGLISMEVDAWRDGAADDVVFVPIAVDYEKLVEEKSYVAELQGREKTKETLSGLMRASKVLKRRYGKVYVQFGQPISLKTLWESRRAVLGSASEVPIEAEISSESESGATVLKRKVVQQLATRIGYGINQLITTTPTGLLATALLSHTRRGLSPAFLADRIDLLRSIAAEQGARFSSGFSEATSDPATDGPVARALAELIGSGFVTVRQFGNQTFYQVVADRRPQLDFYRNNLIHRYVSSSLVATALRGNQGMASLQRVRDDTLWLSRLFKLEFVYRTGVAFDVTFNETVELLERFKALQREGETLKSGKRPEVLTFLADIVRAHLEGYRVAAETLLAASPRELASTAALLKLALGRGQAAFAAGRISLSESISKVLYENAIDWFKQQQALENGDGRWKIASSWREVKLAQLIADIDRMLDGARPLVG